MWMSDEEPPSQSSMDLTRRMAATAGTDVGRGYHDDPRQRMCDGYRCRRRTVIGAPFPLRVNGADATITPGAIASRGRTERTRPSRVGSTKHRRVCTHRRPLTSRDTPVRNRAAPVLAGHSVRLRILRYGTPHAITIFVQMLQGLIPHFTYIETVSGPLISRI